MYTQAGTCWRTIIASILHDKEIDAHQAVTPLTIFFNRTLAANFNYQSLY